MFIGRIDFTQWAVLCRLGVGVNAVMLAARTTSLLLAVEDFQNQVCCGLTRNGMRQRQETCVQGGTPGELLRQFNQPFNAREH